MEVAVSSTTEHGVEVQFQGHPGNACPAFALDISWNNKIVIAWDTGTGTYSLDLEHDGFPNHQIRVNGDIVYEYDVVAHNDATPLSLGAPKEIEEFIDPQPL